MVADEHRNGAKNMLTSAPSSSSLRRAEDSASIGYETAENDRKTRRPPSGTSRRHISSPSAWVVVTLLALTLGTLMHVADAQPCPNSCNGHGRCSNPDRTCYCFTGYLGPDCSRLSCPYGTAWVDLAAGNDNAHNVAECSNMGLCDRSTGTCTCRSGFGGKACERMTCPGTTSQCNGVGVCRSMLYNALTKVRPHWSAWMPPTCIRPLHLTAIPLSPCPSPSYKDPGTGPVYTYNATWDAEKIWGCNCDSGAPYLGPYLGPI